MRRALGWIEGVGRELSLATRTVGRRPATVLVAVASLALGIGANTAVFSVVEVSLLRRLAYPEADRLVRVWETGMALGERFTGSVSVPNLLDWQTRNRSFAALGGYSVRDANLLGDDGLPVRLPTVAVTAETLGLLGIAPRQGRLFVDGDDDPGAAPTVVIGDGMWRRTFGADPAAIGRTLHLDGREHTVVGVMPPGFAFPPRAEVEVWTPLVLDPERHGRGSHWMHVLGRLEDGVPLAAATAEMEAIAAQIAAEHPDEQTDRSVLLRTLHESLVGSTRALLLSLWGAVGLVLLIACGNVAHLLLARGAERTGELAIRTALGASRRRLAAAVLAESLVLALVGGAVGVLVGGLFVRWLVALPGAAIPPGVEVGLDARVLAVSFAAALLAAGIGGLAPALRASRVDLVAVTKGGGGRSVSRRDRLRGGLVVAEVALAVTVLVGAVLLGESLRRLLAVDFGIDTAGAVTAHLSIPDALEREAAADLYGRILERVASVPGTEAAGMVSFLPYENWGWNGNFEIAGRPPATTPADAPFAEMRRFAGDYFRAAGVPLLAGRLPDSACREDAVAINATLAERYWPAGDALSATLVFGDPEADGYRLRVAGIVADVRNVGLEQPTRGEIYFPVHRGAPREMTLVLRTAREPAPALADLRAAVAEVDPTIPVFRTAALDEAADGYLDGRRWTVLLFAAFALLALLLAVAGVYGLLTHEIGQRTWEIGVRMAIGARPGDVVAEVLRRGLLLAALGATVGLALAAVTSRFLAAQLYELRPTDPWVQAAVVALLLAVTALSALGPARRASAVDPSIALRDR